MNDGIMRSIHFPVPKLKQLTQYYAVDLFRITIYVPLLLV